MRRLFISTSSFFISWDSMFCVYSFTTNCPSTVLVLFFVRRSNDIYRVRILVSNVSRPFLKLVGHFEKEKKSRLSQSFV